MKFVLFRRRDVWRWRLVVRNGRAVAESTQGYHNRRDCLASISMVMEADAATPVEDETSESSYGAELSAAGAKTGSLR
jgi:uncharacterized protein